MSNVRFLVCFRTRSARKCPFLEGYLARIARCPFFNLLSKVKRPKMSVFGGIFGPKRHMSIFENVFGRGASENVRFLGCI